MRSDRIDWSSLKDRIDMAAIAAALLGPAAKRSGRRLLWHCPLHDDHDPSFQVDPAERRWRCWPCDQGGDAPGLVMKLREVGFPEAVRIVAELSGIVAPSGGKPASPRPPAAPLATARKPARVAHAASERPSGLPLADALALVESAEKRLWTSEGAAGLEYLRRDRGLRDEMIGASRLGWTPGVGVTTRDGTRDWRVAGITIPWFDGDRLARVKIRRPEGSEPRYAEAFSDRPRIYPGPEVIRPGAPLAIVEGEFDRMLLGQEIGDLASVATLGSTSARLDDDILWMLAGAWPLFIATDADSSGEGAAAKWPSHTRRVRPPAGKDWTEAHQAGIDLRRWWVEEVFADVFDREERAAIMEFEGGLSREAAERAAGLTGRE
jgi:DNA primase